jgi:hypothetical protein
MEPSTIAVIIIIIFLCVLIGITFIFEKYKIYKIKRDRHPNNVVVYNALLDLFNIKRHLLKMTYYDDNGAMSIKCDKLNVLVLSGIKSNKKRVYNLVNPPVTLTDPEDCVLHISIDQYVKFTEKYQSDLIEKVNTKTEVQEHTEFVKSLKEIK